jgi:hypothetical protein
MMNGEYSHDEFLLLKEMAKSSITKLSTIDGVQDAGLNRGVRKRLGAGELGDSLGALRDGVLGEFTREDEPDGSLDLP